jgi:hypothetical protein
MSECSVCDKQLSYVMSSAYDDVVCLNCAAIVFARGVAGYFTTPNGAIKDDVVPYTSNSPFGIEMAKYRADPSSNCCQQCGKKHI